MIFNEILNKSWDNIDINWISTLPQTQRTIKYTNINQIQAIKIKNSKINLIYLIKINKRIILRNIFIFPIKAQNILNFHNFNLSLYK